MKLGYMLLIVFAVIFANELQCESVGYKEYLDLYSFKPSVTMGSYYEYVVLLTDYFKGTLF